MQKKIISVIGGRVCSRKVELLAHDLGNKLAKVVDYLVTGGLGGVMEAVSKGFHEAGGTTIGILPNYRKKDANAYIDIALPTGMGLARNVLVVKSADVVIALPGQAGTLSEIAYCLQFGVPVICIVQPGASSLTNRFLSKVTPPRDSVFRTVDSVEKAIHYARLLLAR